MNVIVFSHQHGRARQFNLRSPGVVAGALAVVLVVVGYAAIGALLVVPRGP